LYFFAGVVLPAAFAVLSLLLLHLGTSFLRGNPSPDHQFERPIAGIRLPPFPSAQAWASTSTK
jgi:hypothetical protein